MRYVEKEELLKNLANKRIVKWDEGKIVMEDGTVLSIDLSEQDCCASAYGEFNNVKLDAMITDIVVERVFNGYSYDDDTYIDKTKVIIFHNQNEVAQANAYADAGNGGYYYSICSLVVNDLHYPVAETLERRYE